jgi:hypothetical protein
VHLCCTSSRTPPEPSPSCWRALRKAEHYIIHMLKLTRFLVLFTQPAQNWQKGSVGQFVQGCRFPTTCSKISVTRLFSATPRTFYPARKKIKTLPLDPSISTTALCKQPQQLNLPHPFRNHGLAHICSL